MRHIITHRFVSIILIIMGFIVAHQPSVAAEPPLRFGTTYSSEGQYKDLSYMVINGYKTWVEEINSRGGLLGRQVELVILDDKSKKERITPHYKKLILNEKVDIILSPYGSTLTLEAARVANLYNMVLLAATASSVKIWQQGFTHVFGVYSTADRYFIGFLDIIARQQMKNVGIVYRNTTFNVSAAEGSRKWANLFGLHVPIFSRFTQPSEDLPKIVDTLISYKLKNIIFCGYPDEGYQFLNLLKEKKYKPEGLAMTIIPAQPDFYENVGSFADRIFGPSQWEPDPRLPLPDIHKFIQNFKRLTGKQPSYQACSSYTACRIIEEAITKIGFIDQQEIRNFIYNIDTITPMGRFKVGADGRQIAHNPILIQWQQGKKEIVYPLDLRTSPPLFSNSKRTEP